MANKKVLVWVAIGSALLIGGGIFWWMKTRDKNKGDDKDVTNPDNKDVVTPPTPTPTPTPPNTGGGGYTPSVANPFKTAQDVKDFQNWLDKNHPTWLKGGKLSQGGGYGNFGSNTQKAWTDYGVEYKTAITALTPAQILAQNKKAFETAMSDAKKAGSPSFVFQGKIYDTKTGKIYVDPSIIQLGDVVYSTDEVQAYNGSGLVTPYDRGGNCWGQFRKNQLVGTVTGIYSNQNEKSFKVENNKAPMTSGDNTYTSFFIPQRKVTKVKPSTLAQNGSYYC